MRRVLVASAVNWWMELPGKGDLFIFLLFFFMNFLKGTNACEALMKIYHNLDKNYK